MFIVFVRPNVELKYRFYLDIVSSIFLIYIWNTNTVYYFGTRLSFDIGLDRSFPGTTAVYCFLFMLLSVKIKLPILFLISLCLGYLTQSRNFALALIIASGVNPSGSFINPVWRKKCLKFALIG